MQPRAEQHLRGGVACRGGPAAAPKVGDPAGSRSGGAARCRRPGRRFAGGEAVWRGWRGGLIDVDVVG